ncbi:helix-turn-helix domain-containing protein [Arenibaculum sp.]|uniref:helix-turn-helix domain-containing protein n=1 Tax=Arenibaculum sp. TaxID=2865862 RepID=UPI002E13913C|nr:helix-turn-helix domain-containing protein [Arenibaculum sp.]
MTASSDAPDADGFTGRLNAVVRLFASRSEAAAAAGVSTDQLRRYLLGQSAASFRSMVSLAAARGVSLDWLATGCRPMYVEGAEGGSPDRDVITPDLIRAVVLYWLSANEVLDQPRPAEDLARLIADQCELMRGEERAAWFFADRLLTNIGTMTHDRRADVRHDGGT